MVLLVCTVLWVPAAVRATQRVNQTTTTLRLNRGFDLPVEKQVLQPADMVALLPAVLARQEAASAVAVRRPADFDDATLPDLPDTRSPDPLRGPPVSSPA